MNINTLRHCASLFTLAAITSPVTWAQSAGDTPQLSERITQDQVVNELTLLEARAHGMRLFTTPFNVFDGYGDGPFTPGLDDGITPGQRPSMQDENNLFLRMNGLDSQTCLECHSIVSNATIPATFGIGGVGGVSASAFPLMTEVDLDDSEGNGYAQTNGRMINPPFNFGLGGVELLAKEMTADLQAIKAQAQTNEGQVFDLITKGVYFGYISYVAGTLDTSGIEGVNDDLVVRPFGRKGGRATVRDFDVDALQFHLGMQAEELFEDPNTDGDGDGISKEITVGELSAMHIFQATLDAPAQSKKSNTETGEALFASIGCAQCHIPEMTTESRFLPIAFPEVFTDPYANVFMQIDLRDKSPGFKKDKNGPGVIVPLFADLKRHDMGPDLAETTGDDLDPFFTTAKLWGVADTAPYLHDGRATTISQAILMHGGEAQTQRDNYAALNNDDQQAILDFLGSLRVPFDATDKLVKELQKNK